MEFCCFYTELLSTVQNFEFENLNSHPEQNLWYLYHLHNGFQEYVLLGCTKRVKSVLCKFKHSYGFHRDNLPVWSVKLVTRENLNWMGIWPVILEYKDVRPPLIIISQFIGRNFLLVIIAREIRFHFWFIEIQIIIMLLSVLFRLGLWILKTNGRVEMSKKMFNVV